MEDYLKPTSKTYEGKQDAKILPSLYRNQQKAEPYFDVKIIAGGLEIKAHRVILGAYSDFFDNKFKSEVNKDENNNTVVELDDIDCGSTSAIIEFIYTSNITITNKNVYKLAYAADYFQIQEIKVFCIEFLKSYLCSDNCLRTLQFAKVSDIVFLKEQANAFLYSNLRFVMKTIAFKTLSLDEVTDIIQEKDNTSIKVCQSHLYEAVVNWIKHDANRTYDFLDLFKLIKLELLKPCYLAKFVANEELVMSSLPCLQLLAKAYQTYYNDIENDVKMREKEQKHLKKLVEEREMVAKGFKEASFGVWFVVSTQWMDHWQKYVTNDGFEWDSKMRRPSSPGPIDNASLFTNKHCKMIRENVTKITDYKFVPEKVWKALVGRYGTVEGQPPINEKGLVLKQTRLSVDEDEILIIDPIQLKMILKKKIPGIPVIKTFSRWDTIEFVDQEMRKEFKIQSSDVMEIFYGQKVLNKEKTIKEVGLSNNNTVLLEVLTLI